MAGGGCCMLGRNGSAWGGTYMPTGAGAWGLGGDAALTGLVLASLRGGTGSGLGPRYSPAMDCTTWGVPYPPPSGDTGLAAAACSRAGVKLSCSLPTRPIGVLRPKPGPVIAIAASPPSHCRRPPRGRAVPPTPPAPGDAPRLPLREEEGGEISVVDVAGGGGKVSPPCPPSSVSGRGASSSAGPDIFMDEMVRPEAAEDLRLLEAGVGRAGGLTARSAWGARGAGVVAGAGAGVGAGCGWGDGTGPWTKAPPGEGLLWGAVCRNAWKC